jgi:hypothetical protein
VVDHHCRLSGDGCQPVLAPCGLCHQQRSQHGSEVSVLTQYSACMAVVQYPSSACS